MAFAVKRRPLPPPLNVTNFHPFFTTFFFLLQLKLTYETDFTPGLSQIIILSPLMIGSKLTFAGSCARRPPYSAIFIVTSTTIYSYKAQTMCKTRFGSQGVILDGF